MVQRVVTVNEILKLLKDEAFIAKLDNDLQRAEMFTAAVEFIKKAKQ